MQTLEQLKFPAGKLQIPDQISEKMIQSYIQVIAGFPKKVAEEIKGLTSNELLNYHYRSGGWSIKQVVNHCIDSHMNSVIRFKLALTEENPTIKPYNETAWGELPDSLEYSIEESLLLLSSIHKRWVFLLKGLTEEMLNRTFVHPDGNEVITLKQNLCIYAWHCENHFLHIANAKKYKFSKN